MNIYKSAQQAIEVFNDIIADYEGDRPDASDARDALIAALYEFKQQHIVEATLKEQGWRQCAEGQNTTQFCAVVEQAIQDEREACAKVCEDGLLWGQRYAAAIRSRT